MSLVIVQAPCWSIHSPPYSLALLKAACQAEGYKVKCLDFNIEFYNYLVGLRKNSLYDRPTDWYNDDFVKKIINLYGEFIEECVKSIISIGYKTIGFTITGLNRLFSEEIARRVKEENSDKIIIFGGPHCTKSEMGASLLHTNQFVDAICYLEGEKVLPQIVAIVERCGKVSGLNGIAFRDINNDIISCPEEELIENLDELPFADYSDFNFDKYHLDEFHSHKLAISTSRGCINKCIFCSESRNWKKYRTRSAGNIFDEIMYQINKHPCISSLFLNDSLINGDLKVLNGLCDRLVDSKIKLNWGGQASIREEMNLDLLSKMKMAGCSHITYGLESLSPKTLKTIGKRFTPELVELVLQNTHTAGITADVTLIIGLPGEEDVDIILTAEFIKRNRRFIGKVLFHLLVIAKGTYIYENRRDFGIELEDNFNSVRWHSRDGENTLQKRIEILEFCNNYIGREEDSFYSPSEYYLFLGDKRIENNEHKQALAYYIKAKDANDNGVKDKIIDSKIDSAKGCLMLEEDVNIFNYSIEDDKGQLDFLKNIQEDYLYNFSLYLNKPLVGPFMYQLLLTTKCNLRCKMCGVWNANEDELDMFYVKKSIDDVYKLGNLKQVYFTGGEALMRPDIFNLVKYVKDYYPGIIVHLNTNGTILSRKIIDRLIDVELDTLGISIDSPNADIHNSLRGEGVFEQAIEAINYINVEKKRRKKIFPRVNTLSILMNQTLDTMYDMLDFCLEYDLCGICVQPYVCNTDLKGMRSSEFWIPEQRLPDLDDALRKIEEKKKRMPIHVEIPCEKIYTYFSKAVYVDKCYAGFTRAILVGKKLCFVCNGPNDRKLQHFGEGDKDSWDTVWFSKDAEHFRNTIRNCRNNCVQFCSIRPSSDSAEEIHSRLCSKRNLFLIFQELRFLEKYVSLYPMLPLQELMNNSYSLIIENMEVLLRSSNNLKINCLGGGKQYLINDLRLLLNYLTKADGYAFFSPSKAHSQKERIREAIKVLCN